MTSLKSITEGHNKFCGPAVLSILTGRSTDECAYAITRINGQYNVQGVTITDLIKAADALGYDCQAVAQIGLSLFRTLTTISNNDGIYIVMIPKHFVVIEVKDKKIYFCDNHTKEPINAESSARLGMPVQGIYKVTPKPKPPKLEPSYIVVTKVQCTYCKSIGDTEKLVYHPINCPFRIGLEANEK